MEKQPNRRSWKNYLVRTDIQLPIIATNLAFVIAVGAILIVILLSPLYYDMLIAEEPWVRHISGNLFLILLQRLAMALLLIAILAAIHQTILSHRLCGPLVNFGHTFDKMVRGDFSRKVHLRRRDFLKAEAVSVNAIINRLNTDGAVIKKDTKQMAMLVEALRKQHLQGESAKLVDELYESIQSCLKTVDRWTLR